MKPVIFLLLIILCIEVNAQETIRVDSLQRITQLYTLDSVEVTATRIPTSVTKTGKNVTVISQSDIQKMPVTSVDELFRYVSGLNINGRQGFGVQSDIGIRGSTFAQVLFVVDNVRLNDPLTAHFNNNVPIALSEIEQIEIVRGPAGASYGADAVGGLIHIKTKHYNAQKGKDTLQISAQVGLGQHQLYFSDLGVWHQRNNILLTGGVQTNIAKGEVLTNPNFGSSGGDSLFNNYFNIKTYSAALSYFLDDVYTLNFRSSIDQRDFSAKYFYTRSLFDESTETVNSTWNQLGIKRKIDNTTSQVNIGLKTNKDEFIFNPSFTTNEHKTRQFQIGLNHTHELSNLAKIGGGLQFISKRIKSNDRGNHANSSIALYADAVYPVTFNIAANGSLRLEYDGNFGFEVLPQLSLAYTSSQYVLRASLGKSIRAADFTERFVSSTIENLSPGRNIGNPDLEAERSWSFEVGGDYYYDASLKGSATLFYRTSKNLIDYIFTNSDEIENVENLQANESYFYAINVSKSRTSGLELNLKKHWSLNDWLTVNAQVGYTLLGTKTPNSTVSKYIANHPRHNFSWVIDASIPKFQLISTANLINRSSDFSELIGAEINKNYFITNLKLLYQPFENSFGIFYKVHNFTNTKYSEILGAQMPRRWNMFGIQGSLSK